MYRFLAILSYLMMCAAVSAQGLDDQLTPVYIRDAATNQHNGIHYWCSAADNSLGYTFDGQGNADCRFFLVDAGADAAGHPRYFVRHEASGLYVKGLKFLTTNDSPDDSNQFSPLVASRTEAHALTFEEQPDGNYLISDRNEEAGGYFGADGYYNYAMCGNHGNVGGYYRDYDFGPDGGGLYTFACSWEIVPAVSGDDLGQADFPQGEEVYICLIPRWSSHGEYLWTSDGTWVSLVRLDKDQPTNNDFAAAAFIKVPTEQPDRYKLFHIQSRRYLYGLNYIADNKNADPTDIYDGDPWDNQSILTDQADRAHALIINHDYSWTSYSGRTTYDFADRGWWVIKDPVAENNHDGCHYYGGEYGYCVYMAYANTSYELGGIGAVYCSSPGGYMADPWAIRTPHEFADYLGLPDIPSQIPVGIRTPAVPDAGSTTNSLHRMAAGYDLQGRTTTSAGTPKLYISGGKVHVQQYSGN